MWNGRSCRVVRAMAVMVVVLGGASVNGVRAAEAQADASTSRPNIIFILVDDMRADAMSCAGHPFLKTPNIDRIAAQGAWFTNAFVTTSLCSPARASFLTGTYAHVHQVRSNEGRDPDPALATFPQLLQSAGYETAYIGKWHMAPHANPRPGFDYWLSFSGQGTYVDPKLNENGREFQASGYMTDLLSDYAIKWLEKPRDKPFCLYLSHKAAHGDFIPAQRHENAFADTIPPEPASYRDDLSMKPRWQRIQRVRGGRLQKPAPAALPDALIPEPWERATNAHARILNWHRTLLAVDEGVGRLFDTLKQAGQLDRTVIVFAGDNGFFHGEHGGLSDKRFAYEESMRIPLLVYGPGIKAGATPDQLALNIDVAPTLLEMAGARIPQVMQGRSLVPILRGQSPEPAWREDFLYEYFKEAWLPGVPTMLAVRSKNWKYVHCPDLEDLDELYDLRHDPQEMRNLAADPAQADQVARMRKELDRLKNETRWTEDGSSTINKQRTTDR